MSSRRLQEDVLQTRLEDVLKTYWKTKKCYAEDVLKTSSTRIHQDECLVGMFLSYKLSEKKKIFELLRMSEMSRLWVIILSSNKRRLIKKRRSAKPVMLE